MQLRLGEVTSHSVAHLFCLVLLYLSLFSFFQVAAILEGMFPKCCYGRFLDTD
jgi:hypothetical protein